MVLFRGPSSTISDPIGATHLPSDVPPPLSILVSILFISLIDDFTISMNSVFAVKNGRALSVQLTSYLRSDFFNNASNFSLSPSGDDSGENLKLKVISKTPGTTFSAPVPDLIFET